MNRKRIERGCKTSITTRNLTLSLTETLPISMYTHLGAERVFNMGGGGVALVGGRGGITGLWDRQEGGEEEGTRWGRREGGDRQTDTRTVLKMN